ncbi:MAG: glycosyltransferase family 2 protein, partial [Roseburia sp.]
AAKILKTFHILIIFFNKSQIKNKNSRKSFVVSENYAIFAPNKTINIKNVMNDNIQLSVIIPVYNTQEYLERCVNGVIANKGINMEIILVDDGSTDTSPSLCDNYSSKYDFIKAIHISNSGPATAKNRGLEIARGEYVAMIDSDDEPKHDMFERMINAAKKNDADIVCCNYLERYDNGSTRTFNYTNETTVLDHYHGVEHFLMKKKIYTQCWTKIYRRRMLEQFRVRNVEGLKTDEDFIFNICSFVHAQKTCIVDSPLYIYSIRGTSLSKDYFNKDINAYINNRLLRFDIVDKNLRSYAKYNLKHAVFNRLFYSNELLGRIALFPSHFSDKRTQSVIRYMRRHILYALSVHREIGFSIMGCLMLLLPTPLYMRYRHNKLNK